uniref:GH29D-like beta-sandwich domain-containing protein n=1 Tax=Gracilinema caldarium TaxID=215591 RepID=A0A7C3I108_9SPIR
MRRRLVPLWISSLLMLVPLALPAQTEGLQTNALSGSYNRDQRFWFSAPPSDRLVVSLDGKELFKGMGSASVLLSVPMGTEKNYTILAQRRSAPPLNSLLEEKTFTIHIDKLQPQKPALSASTDDGLFYSVAIESEKDAVLEGFYSLSGVVNHIEGSEKSSAFNRTLQAPFHLIVWAVDAAGNCSDLVGFSAEAAHFSVLNPVPGIWQNTQRLVLQKQGSGKIYWTDDGSDPFSSSGRLYEKPILVQKTGKIRLRVGMKLSNGLSYEKSIVYEVAGTSEEPFKVPEEIHETSTLPLNGDFQWAIENGPWLDKTIPIKLVPVKSSERYVALLVKNARGTYRYSILLNGKGVQENSAIAVANKEPIQAPEKTEKEAVSRGPLLMTAGDLRVLYFNNNDMGIIRYQLNADPVWKDYSKPIILPTGPATIAWLLDKGLAQEGPEQRTFAEQSSQGQQQSPNGWIAYRSLYLEPGEFHILNAYTGDTPPLFTACTGEDLEWKLYSADGKELFVQRTDGLPPPAPSLSAPPEGAWVSGAVGIQSSVPAAEEGVKTQIRANLQYPSGRVERLEGENTLAIEVPKESPVIVTLTAIALDAAGNQSPKISRTFTIDANSVYVSNRGLPDGDGSRNRPVDSLERALELAQELGRSSIRIQDSVSIDKPLTMVPGVTLESLSTEKLGEINLIKQGKLIITPGTVLFRRIAIRSETQSSPVIEIRGGNLEMTDTNLFMKGSALRAMVGTSGGIYVANSSINLDALESATALWAEDCTVSLQDTAITVKAGQYANGVEQRRGSFIQRGGSVFVTAQDGCLWQFSSLKSAQIDRVQATLASSFVAQACVSEGLIPQFSNSVLFFKGSSPRSSVFTFPNVDASLKNLGPAKDTVFGNYFIGFTSLLNTANLTMDIKTFNRTFAAPDTPNFIDEVP